MKIQILKFIILLSLFISISSAQDNYVIGYIDDAKYHPLIITDYGIIQKPDCNSIVFPEWVVNAFEQSELKIVISKPIFYIDVYSDEEGKYCTVLESLTFERDAFFANDTIPKIELSSPKKDMLIYSFYRFFSTDNWGKHFISRDLLKKSIHEISGKSSIIIHHITDLDTDSLYELWISYKLSYGEIGRMVYEQSAESFWIPISSKFN